jgi:hypothetical protein
LPHTAYRSSRKLAERENGVGRIHFSGVVLRLGFSRGARKRTVGHVDFTRVYAPDESNTARHLPNVVQFRPRAARDRQLCEKWPNLQTRQWLAPLGLRLPVRLRPLFTGRDDRHELPVCPDVTRSVWREVRFRSRCDQAGRIAGCFSGAGV